MSAKCLAFVVMRENCIYGSKFSVILLKPVQKPNEVARNMERKTSF